MTAIPFVSRMTLSNVAYKVVPLHLMTATNPLTGNSHPSGRVLDRMHIFEMLWSATAIDTSVAYHAVCVWV
ncbi:hypothetical protein M404DRAFT_1000901 [Pisolithus tinctorius Marx 270]|uniref:Uncharacterized protein n=1 Tax=Pisolithus tinctorius Marx 270 TaxID=870435 RepID=A0A0C3P8M7_PISTI|nr:hypothetical protein M404DRAFT_1000901 [Pisolithus tinctorius Marx 270]